MIIQLYIKDGDKYDWFGKIEETQAGDVYLIVKFPQEKKFTKLSLHQSGKWNYETQDEGKKYFEKHITLNGYSCKIHLKKDYHVIGKDKLKPKRPTVVFDYERVKSPGKITDIPITFHVDSQIPENLDVQDGIPLKIRPGWIQFYH